MQKDLLRLLRDPNLIPSNKQTLLSNIAAQAASMNIPCYVVGGFVRDLLLNQPVNDLDIVVEGNAIEFGNALVKQNGGKLTSHTKFHTAVWHLPDIWHLTPNTLDLITSRSETYSHSGALPTIKPSRIEDDLRRRDFTINAMAIRLDGEHFGELLDPLHGQNDLEQKQIQVLHPLSFTDDPTRIFRALRYSARYSFIIHPSALILLNLESLSVLQTLSGERIRHELDLIFEEEKSAQIIHRAGELDIFKYIHPELPEFNSAYSSLLNIIFSVDFPISRINIGYMFWLIDLSEKNILSIAKRLDFSSELTNAVLGASQTKKILPTLKNSKPSAWTFALEKLPLQSVYAVYLITHEKPLLDYLSTWRHIKTQTTGDDLKSRGLVPGPRFGEILSQLRAAWLDGEIKNYKEEEDFLNTLL